MEDRCPTVSRTKMIAKWCFLAGISVVVISVSFMHWLEFYQMCGKDHIQDLCHEFEQGMIAGSLCQDLCQNKTITLHSCLSTEPQKTVYKAMWKDKEIILKIHDYNEIKSCSFSHLKTKDDYANEISATVNMLFGDCENCSLLTEKLAGIADVDNDGQLSLAETKTLVTLLRTPEPCMLLVSNESKHMLKMFGYCGTMIAVEKLPVIADTVFGYWGNFLDVAVLPSSLEHLEESLKIFTHKAYQYLLKLDAFKQTVKPLLDNFKYFVYQKAVQVRIPSLDERFNFLFSLLDAIFALSNNPYGMFQSCDSHLGNFGLSESCDVKMIDSDQTLPIHHLQNILGALKCGSDRDCRIGDFSECSSQCNTSKGFCMSELKNQNLQNICADAFPTVFRNVHKDFDGQNTKHLICLEKAVNSLALFCFHLPLVKSLAELQKHFENIKQKLLKISLGEFHCE